MSEDLVKVVIDYDLANSQLKNQIDTGQWIKIYQGEKLDFEDLPNK